MPKKTTVDIHPEALRHMLAQFSDRTADAAKTLGVSRSTINRYLAGTHAVPKTFYSLVEANAAAATSRADVQE